MLGPTLEELLFKLLVVESTVFKSNFVFAIVMPV